MKVRIFKNVAVLQEEYVPRDAGSMISFENHLYAFVAERRMGSLKYHLYYCPNERHYILIHMRYDVPILIKAFYSTEHITAPAILSYVAV